MYSVVTIYYGVEPEGHIKEDIVREEIHEIDGVMFEAPYSGMGEGPVYLGAHIKSLDPSDSGELSKFLDLSNLDKVKEKYEELKAKSIEKLKNPPDWADEIGPDIFNDIIEWLENAKPTVRIIWSTS